ncbi:UNVERIFIED_ORG: hypothetical protein GGI57_005588 [Rhizobium aethiopicum]|uniref:Uncharacterized protein n=3 Tax=Rhizobium TaxID=379 RepID=A0A7W6ZMK5_RHIET|nr:hypothetical protein [Rhizobium aethiopicum]MBB4300850.1 hypothetical protein [Rhizobium leguminosarum]MBB4436546.1 hypothetical protein [Rhizobium esperanzae]MBB4482996.1 hypothetical protein [Rhizobium etli]MBB4332428.1 hypothetical protein [Rhizobium leguminosarum]
MRDLIVEVNHLARGHVQRVRDIAEARLTITEAGTY